MLEQRLAVDGFTAAEMDALTNLAGKWGLVDAATLRALKGVNNFVTGVEEGTKTWDDAAASLDYLIAETDGATGAMNGAAGAANSAAAGFATAAQRAGELDAQLAAMAGRRVAIEFEFKIPALPSLPGETRAVAMANGFDGVFRKPTMAIFGEAGPEYVRAVPLGRGGTDMLPGNDNGGPRVAITVQPVQYRQNAGTLTDEIRYLSTMLGVA
jgi:hypothetical protein